MGSIQWESVAGEIVQRGPSILMNVLSLVLILIISKIIIGAVCRVVLRVLQRADRVNPILENFTVDILRKTLWVITAMIALAHVGIDVGPLVAGLGVAGFVIGFAFQESLGNLAAGLMLTLNQPFTVGDVVEAGGSAGKVMELNLMATTLTTPDNKKVMLPNSSVWGSAITNYTAMETRRVDLVVGIAYGASIEQAKQVISGVVTANEMVLADPEPVIEVVAMADSSVNLVVRPWCETANYWDVYFALHQDIKLALDANGIEIPFPQMDLHHHNLPERA